MRPLTLAKRVPAALHLNKLVVQRIGGRVVYSASDLNNFLECPHISELDKLVMAGTLERPPRSDGAEILAEYGALHEQSYLDAILAGGHPIVTIDRDWSEAGLSAAARRTEEAMAAGASHIAQATFFDGAWVGYADLVRRIEEQSARWRWSYEAVDAKLARHDKPYFVLQLCFYSEQIARVQGSAPRRMWLYLGSREERPHRYADFEAYYRRVKERFARHVGIETDTYPYPIPYCDKCRYSILCAAKREADDHPSLVEFARRDQIECLAAARPPITTMTALAQAAPTNRPPDLAPSTFDKLRRQADVQCRSRDAGAPVFEFLPTATLRGLDLLPPVSEGDVFFDIEGDPFADGGLEYLLGVVTIDGSAPVYSHYWSDDAAAEKVAFESFIDFVTERRKQYQDLHVYHYSSYEPTALKRLMIRHLTREVELDGFLRSAIFVDLFTVIRQGMVVPGYSLKNLEQFYWARAREGAVTTAIDSVLAYERWRHEKRESDKTQILDYNRIDCESTHALRDWLLARRDEAYEKFGVPVPLAERERKPTKDETIALRQRQGRLVLALAARVPADDSLTLLSRLLMYHRREQKPVWWEFFDRCSQTSEELVDDGAAIGALAPVPDQKPTLVKRSLVYRFTFPPQQHKIEPGSTVYDCYGTSAGTVVDIDDDAGTLSLRRGLARDGEALPRALVPLDNFPTHKIEQALCDFAEAVLAGDAGAGKGLLFREPPHIAGIAPNAPLQHDDISKDDIKALCRELQESHLFIQGPPGSGKTYTGARLIVDLLLRKRRIAVSANSHKAIDNLLREIETVAFETGCSFRGLKKTGADEGYESPLDSPLVTSIDVNAACFADDIDLVAGTVWLFAEPDLRGRFDYLFIDEAGQVPLANALAMSMVAKNVVLLGDPLQLAQVVHGAQQEGAQASVLEHLLGTDATIPPDRGVFLTLSYRMHPTICKFISDAIYDGRLHSASGCELQRVGARGFEGAGLRFIGVDHDGDPQRSREEADAVFKVVDSVLGGTVTDRFGQTRSMELSDVLVVAPYNVQVKTIKDVLDAHRLGGVRVGTVDKFQGQEAAVVVFSMATPTAADVPHGLEFLFSQNRLNVAISRAKCRSVIVASPRLLDASCRTVDQMRLVNTLCRFVEVASS